MTQHLLTPSPEPAARSSGRSIAEVKAELLGWAEERDRNAKPMLPGAGVVIGGGIAILAGGLILSRLLGPRPIRAKPGEPNVPVGTRLIGVLIAARMARWLVPLAVAAGRAFFASVPRKN